MKGTDATLQSSAIKVRGAEEGEIDTNGYKGRSSNIDK